MCIAAVIFKPLTLAELKLMDEENPHGGGVACVKQGRIWFLKGLDAGAIHGLQEAGVLSYPYLLHFRWATQGARIPELCHPFPLGPRALMGETTGFADKVLIHNGTWYGYLPYLPVNSEIPDSVFKVASDTAIAAYLADTDPGVLEQVSWATATATMSDTGEMDITTRGTWTDHGGNWYSNLNWLPSNKYDWQNWADWRRSSGNPYSTYSDYAPKPVPVTKITAEEEEEAMAMAALLGPGEAHARREREQELADSYGEAYPGVGKGETTWEEYIKTKYGEEVANELLDDPSDVRAGKSVDQELADLDIVSEDFDRVNSIIARQMIKEGV